ncbi:acetyl-CoA C-acyltransferase [Truepera radiovictrix]|uniref:acetyl-CoA C-acyltransferase n=1 Tax=Truepera radiovictrix (strain DSM 17093 / CIP 108686 / LMG 22925 / RQ-24) TaxID=649638 RepID=D7CV15_TRURR|nr:acetyl-CoA C-acyltransferase [Truepera radiovictrix]ADI15842.1 acetyl-CoA acetyltransferase [Truepera radiovictrix DSM 17093]WMT58533.1 acetyl-CoA C-acyltransferase [Truepera radiovictrix]
MTKVSQPSRERRVVLVDGVRTPFMRSGTAYLGLTTYDLARLALKGLLARNALDPEAVGYVVMGTVVQNVATSNVARDAALGAGFSHRVPAHTVTMACISANQAVTSAAEAIRSGAADIAVAGGVEMLSDVPPQFPLEVRKRLFEAQRYASPLDYRKLFAGMSPSDLLPRAPKVAEYSTGETMGESADKLAASFGVTREEQDAYALRSHQLAAKATGDGILRDEILPTATPPTFDLHTRDNTVRADSSLEKLAALKPVFVKPFGTVTAGNSSPLTDGASAVLLMEEETAIALGYTPKARLGHYTYVAQDPGEELLLGPAYATPKVLEQAGVTLREVDVIEIHEAFAGQVLAVLRALESDTFGRERLGRSGRVGDVDLDRLNRWGGSLSLGHPFGATGTRLLTTAAHRLEAEDGTLALVTACAAGGLGHAMLVERFEGRA